MFLEVINKITVQHNYEAYSESKYRFAVKKIDYVFL